MCRYFTPGCGDAHVTLTYNHGEPVVVVVVVVPVDVLGRYGPTTDGPRSVLPVWHPESTLALQVSLTPPFVKIYLKTAATLTASDTTQTIGAAIRGR